MNKVVINDRQSMASGLLKEKVWARMEPSLHIEVGPTLRLGGLGRA